MSDLRIIKASLAFAVEPFFAVYAEAAPLMELHWEEIAKSKHLLKINPDLDKYKIANIEGMLITVSARFEGKLVGYLVWLLVPHPHYKHVTIAEDDLHFLLPEYRQGLAGYKFLKAAIGFAQEAGAKIVVMREKIGHQHPALMERLGFKPTDVIYTQVME